MQVELADPAAPVIYQTNGTGPGEARGRGASRLIGPFLWSSGGSGMPTNIRAGLTVVVALVVAAAAYLEGRAADGSLQWLVLVLGALMIGAIWLFPEAKAGDDG